MSKLETNTIDTVSGTSTLQVGSTNTSTITLGVSGDTINVPSGVTIANSGTATGFGANTPAFHAFLSGNQTVSNNVQTTVACNTESFDTDSAYNTSDYKFTPQVAGKYFIYANIVGQTGDYKLYFVKTDLYKNSTLIAQTRNVFNTDCVLRTSEYLSITVDMNGSSDFLILKGTVDIHTNGTEQFAGDSTASVTYFGGYRIIT